ncbi:protein S100-A5-like isoform X2 [Rhinatrema bivittatum]|nr:protein S100-A5-like isoform X2 [Rhinatrema bivittatum]
MPKFDAQTSTEKSIAILIKTFYKYSGKGGNLLCLEIKELKQLLRKEMPTLNSCLEGNSSFTQVLSTLNNNGKGEVDFKEFMAFIGNFAVAVDSSFVNLAQDEEN